MTVLTILLGLLMIVGGVCLFSTPLATFIGTGYFIIILFFISSLVSIVKGISKKRFDKKFFFGILGVILGLAGILIPDVAEMNNYIILYIAAVWFFLRGILTIMDALEAKKRGAGVGEVVLDFILGVLDIILGICSIAHPAVMAVSLGFLIGLFFIESGVSTIALVACTCRGGSLTVLYVILGALTIVGGIAMLATPVTNFVTVGYCIIILFFINGVIGVVRGLSEQNYGKGFLLAVLSLVLGVVGLVVPGAADMSNTLLLYMAAVWFFIRGILTILDAVGMRQSGAKVLAIILGALEIALGVYSVAHPNVMAVSLGLLVALYFIESGISMILFGSFLSKVAP